MATKLVKHIKFPLALIMSMAIAGSCNGATDYSTNTTSYKSSDQIFPNPERGFWSPSEPIDRNPASPLQLSDLQKVRSQNMTLVRRIYLLSEFKDKPISQSFLDGISKDCETARKAGVKLIVRFTYNWVGGGEDAPRDRILAHLEQLKPIFKDNYDAIAYMEAGFIGYWGQWNRSTNNLVDYALSVTNDARAIFSKILNVLPTSRMVLLPYPKQKMEYFNTTNPLSATEAFNRSERARTGSHNDGFLAGSDDWGFYTYANVERDKAFLNLDNLYVVHGGETANSNSDAQPYIGCSNALKELARLRWSTLNSFDKGYGDGLAVLQKWEKDGCMPEIKRRLGYRFRLLNSSVPRKVKPAGTFSMKFEIANDGWASPYNPRRLEAILRNRQTGNEYYLRVNESPRKWMPGATKIVNIVGGIPANMPAGEYQVLLNLPDPTPRLYNRSAYSIRLANQDVWEASTGYNSLLQSVIVNSSAGGSRYSGSQFFKSR
jgi:hypothetical protein